MGGYFGDYAGPRRHAEGIRAQTQRGQFGKTWWAGRWLKALESLVDPGRLSRGRSYARSGQVTRLDVDKDGVDARVQGSRPSPYQVSIRFQRFADAEWEQVYAVMGSEAIYAAKLLSGEMPVEIENAFAAAGTTLFPATDKDIETSCSCPDWANPCKHVAAVYYLLGERFDADPFLMFLLRGRTGEEVATALRGQRGSSDDATAAAEAEFEPEIPLFDGRTELFWRSATGATPALGFDEPLLDALPIKSLGPPPFWNGDRPFAAVMEQLYRSIGAHARALALGDTGNRSAE